MLVDCAGHCVPCSTGKLEVVPTKLMGTKEDLSVAYSPGDQL